MRKKDILAGLAAALILAIFSFLASSSADGLERIAQNQGFISKSISFIKSPIPDYAFPNIDNEKLAGSIAGIMGVLITFILGLGLSKLISKKI